MDKGRDLSCYTESDSNRGPATQGPSSVHESKPSVIGDRVHAQHKHTHHERDVTIALQATTAARGSGGSPRKQTRAEGPQKVYSF